MALASYSMRARVSGEKSEKTCSRTVASGSILGFWDRKQTCTLGSRLTVPLSGTCWPARTRRKLLLPVPLMPMMPILSPSLR